MEYGSPSSPVHCRVARRKAHDDMVKSRWRKPDGGRRETGVRTEDARTTGLAKGGRFSLAFFWR